jgi:UvrB/uvrC motif
MYQDIDDALQGWDARPGTVQARLVQARDGRQVIQIRVDLGIFQIEINDRPDGTRPHGFATYFDYLRHQARLADRGGQVFVLSEEQCEEADREFIQYYHRRIGWLTLRNFARAMADADHTLAFMDFVRDHSPGEEYTQAHEQYRGFVIFQRTHAAASLAIERNDPEAALDAIHEGLSKLHDFFETYDALEEMEENAMVQKLRKLDQSLRHMHKIEATLQEQLEKAVANEEYEAAARLRDQLRRKRQC